MSEEEKSSKPTALILREAERIITEGKTMNTCKWQCCKQMNFSLFAEATDALTVDRQRLQTVWETCHSVVLRSSPIQQFGIGFGVGW